MRNMTDERGQAMLEMALVLPLLLLILLGIVDFGRVLLIQQTVTEAARDAARYASIGDTDAEVAQAIADDTRTLDHVTWSISPDPWVSGSPVTVTVEDTVSMIDPLLMTFLGSQYAVKSSITMRAE